MSKQNELVELARTGASGGGNKNRIINGSMEVAQRATSSTSGGYVSLDRWYVNQSGGSTTFSQETNVNPSETDSLQKYARLNVSSSSDFTHIRQRIEDVTKIPAGTVTISFYAKGTAPTGGLYVYGEQNFGSGGSSSVDFTAVLLTSSLTSSWVRYSAQITVPSIDGKTIGANSYFGVAIGQHSNTSTTAYDLNITGVQLETGEKATDFEHRSYGDELQRCQRYYEQWDTINGENVVIGTSYSGSNPHAILNMKVIKRAAPTVTLPAAGTGTGQIAFLTGTGSTTSTIGTHSTNRLNTRSIRVAGSGYGGISSSQPSALYAYGGASSFKFDAEL